MSLLSCFSSSCEDSFLKPIRDMVPNSFFNFAKIDPTYAVFVKC